jgi:hypothetical protein
MQSPSVASNGTKVREDETEVLAGSREVASCLPIDLEAAFRLRLRNVSALKDGRSNVLLGSCVRGVGMARNQFDVSRNRHYPEMGSWKLRMRRPGATWTRLPSIFVQGGAFSV